MKELWNYLRQFYSVQESPALTRQYEEWSVSKPLAGLRILDAAPLFRNTLMKHCALIAGGADLTVTYGVVQYDPEAVKTAQDFGIRVRGADELARDEFDIVLDCAGACAGLEPRLGFAELTRSGVQHYERCAKPVFLADAGRIKLIETALGTGDGFIRAMKQLGYSLRAMPVVVFGFGKVGKGIVRGLLAEGAQVKVVEQALPSRRLPGVVFVQADDVQAVTAAIAKAGCIVTVTGVAGALEGKYPPDAFLSHGAVLANMGVEDEFGAEIPNERVLNNNRSLNFILEDPTRMPYIDPVMALHNAGAVWLTQGQKAGCAVPPDAVEAEILSAVRAAGVITNELDDLEEFG